MRDTHDNDKVELENSKFMYSYFFVVLKLKNSILVNSIACKTNTTIYFDKMISKY